PRRGQGATPRCDRGAGRGRAGGSGPRGRRRTPGRRTGHAEGGRGTRGGRRHHRGAEGDARRGPGAGGSREGRGEIRIVVITLRVMAARRAAILVATRRKTRSLRSRPSRGA